jgi:hypothetical protein
MPVRRLSLNAIAEMGPPDWVFAPFPETPVGVYMERLTVIAFNYKIVNNIMKFSSCRGKNADIPIGGPVPKLQF